MQFAAVIIALLIALTPALAQKGDKRGEAQVPRVPREKIPPAPALTPQDALNTFTLQDGFQIELVASEPLVEDPVAMAFDTKGRIWVVEMRGFMPNIDGMNEEDIPGRVSILEDTDGDGKMDRKTVFLDNLVLPRAILIAGGGVLIGEPPKLWFCRDLDGDGKADGKIEVASDYGMRKNPEHTANGLLHCIDNRIYSLYHPWRYRYSGGKWLREPTTIRAQWGLTQDDLGRLFYTSNADHLRGDLVPADYLANKPFPVKLPGVAVKIATNQIVWPGRVNPGVNRGYRSDELKADGRLNRYTAACGTTIYRGDLFPNEFRGNAFVCEPAGNLIRRDILTEKDAVVSAQNAYKEKEFLTSTDERFRPVNLYTGPDGALYVVDMYKGLLQHKLYVTSYLRNQMEDRNLDKPIHMGRIYRIVPPGTKRRSAPDLEKASATDLVGALSHANGWIRDTAQRLLVERQDASAVPALKELRAKSDNAIARLHALWTLEGLGRIDPETLNAALKDPHSKVRAAAVRISESLSSVRPTLLGLLNDPSADVQIQLALSLGVVQQTNELKTIAAKSAFGLAREAARFGLGEFDMPARAKPKGNVAPLSPEQQKLFAAGKEVYEATCLACHQAHGLGQEGLAPPLVDSEWVGGPPERLVRIVLHGLRGELRVKKQKFELDMPSLAVLEDQQIAAVLTYIRHEWGHGYSPVELATVKGIREATKAREDAWTEAELLKVK